MPDSPLSLSLEHKAELLRRYQRRVPETLSYGTVSDFCDSSDWIPQLTGIQGDLKDMQRPQALKMIVGACPPGASLLEVGAGEPYVASILAQLGYSVTAVDPYDGSGRGPTEFECYQSWYPEVRLVREIFSAASTVGKAASFDCIYSISVLEHVHEPHLEQLFAGIQRFLKSGGYSIHLIDHVLEGNGADFHSRHLLSICGRQRNLALRDQSFSVDEGLEGVLARASKDLETYFLSAEGHNRWRGKTPYSEFPFRKVISVHSCARAL